MRFSARLRVACALGLIALSSRRPARALVRLNDGTDQIYVNGSYTLGYQTNVDGSAGGTGDTTNAYMIGLEYQRRAGLIGVNASATYTLTDYLRHRSFDNLVPAYTLEFVKDTGRETGTLSFGATESSQSDAAANVHDVSWDYTASLKVKYPVIDRYFLTGSVDESYLDYVVTGGQPLVNLETYGVSTGLFYILSDERDLFATYQYRVEQSSDHTSTTDDALLFGVDGQVVPQIDGSLSAGYELRYPHGLQPGGIADQSRYGDWAANGNLTWTANRRLTTTFDLSRDFSTASTNATTDTTSATLTSNFAANEHLSATAGGGAGWVSFLGPYGLLPSSTTERRDHYLTGNVGGTYMLNSHLSATLSYNYFRNWSNLALANFSNRSYALTLATRW